MEKKYSDLSTCWSQARHIERQSLSFRAIFAFSSLFDRLVSPLLGVKMEEKIKTLCIWPCEKIRHFFLGLGYLNIRILISPLFKYCVAYWPNVEQPSKRLVLWPVCP